MPDSISRSVYLKLYYIQKSHHLYALQRRAPSVGHAWNRIGPLIVSFIHLQTPKPRERQVLSTLARLKTNSDKTQPSTVGVDDLVEEANTSTISYKSGECSSKWKFRVLHRQVYRGPRSSCVGRQRWEEGIKPTYFA